LCGRHAPPKRLLVDVVGEGSLAVDLDDRNPLAIAGLELRVAVDPDLRELEPELGAKRPDLPERALAEVAPLGVIDDYVQFRDKGHA
jgi:hypothetical protein